MVIGTRGGGGGKEPVTEQLTAANMACSVANQTTLTVTINCENAVERVCEIGVAGGSPSLSSCLLYPVQTESGGQGLVYAANNAIYRIQTDPVSVSGNQVTVTFDGAFMVAWNSVIAGAITYIPA